VTDHELASVTADVADAVRRAVQTALPEAGEVDPLVRPSARADMQANVALPLAKNLKQSPAALAAQIASQLSQAGQLIETAEVSGPGFINITVPAQELWRRTAARLADPGLGVGGPRHGERTVIDYSAPNIAKEMHVGHLRTTVIGDCLVRVLSCLAAEVIRQNHLGDWGTQFGMLIEYLVEHPEQPWRASDLAALGDDESSVSALDELYRAARALFDADPAFADRARSRVVALQSGDEETLGAWREIVAESENAFQAIYHRMGILLTPADSAGESFYNTWLQDVVDELIASGIAVESRGALCVFDPDVLGPDGEPVPLIVRKSDGGFGYDTTDLATIRYRMRDLKADRVLYVVDARQSMHFQLIFRCARRAGWITGDADVRHLPFGTVLGPDGRPFKTRAGGTVRLSDLLDDAVGQARVIVAEKNPDMVAAELDAVAEIVGIGSVKYAELSTSRVKDYVFDVKRMVSFNGDTGAYLQYAHARVNSILRRAADGGISGGEALGGDAEPKERALILKLDAFADCLSDVSESLEPHRLCGYLYDLSKTFTDFYEACPVLKAETKQQLANRLALCRLTAATLKQGLDLLGIAAPEQL
jgi:arginyl-tRNA synthetase